MSSKKAYGEPSCQSCLSLRAQKRPKETTSSARIEAEALNGFAHVGEEEGATMTELRQKLIHDHQQIERLLERTRSYLQNGHTEVALEFFESFQAELAHHEVMEERHLLPLFGSQLPDLAERLHHDHDWLNNEVSELRRSFSNTPENLTRLRALGEALRQHAREEEDRLYEFAEHLARERQQLES